MQQETELKQIKNFKIAIADVEQFKKQIKVIQNFVSEIRLKINKDNFGFIEMTPCNVCLLDFKILSSDCIEYDVAEDLEIGLNVSSLYNVLKVINKNDLIVFSVDTETNKFIIEAKNRNVKKFRIPIIDIETTEKEQPELNFSAKVTTDSKQFKEELKALESVAESVSFNCHKDKLVLNGDGDLSQLDVEIKADDSTIINNNSDDVVKTKYSIEFLKKILEGSILTDDIILEFDRDYPLRATFKAVDKFVLEFILAPRIGAE